MYHQQRCLCCCGLSDLMKWLFELRPGGSITLSERVRMMEEAQHIVQEMRERGCSAQRDSAGREQEEAHRGRTFFNLFFLGGGSLRHILIIFRSQYDGMKLSSVHRQNGAEVGQTGGQKVESTIQGVCVFTVIVLSIKLSARKDISIFPMMSNYLSEGNQRHD